MAICILPIKKLFILTMNSKIKYDYFHKCTNLCMHVIILTRASLQTVIMHKILFIV